MARAREPRGVALIVLAAVDRPRTTVLGRVPAALEWLQGALAVTVALAGARVAGADGTLLGVAQLVPAAVALVAAAGLLDAIVAPVAEADTAAADAAVATARDAPWAEVVFVGAGELGLRARLRAERRAPETTVLLWLEPAPRPWWSSAHPTLAEIAADDRRPAPARARRCPPASGRRSRSADPAASCASSPPRSSRASTRGCVSRRRPARRSSPGRPGWPATRGWPPCRATGP